MNWVSSDLWIYNLCYIILYQRKDTFSLRSCSASCISSAFAPSFSSSKSCTRSSNCDWVLLVSSSSVLVEIGQIQSYRIHKNHHTCTSYSLTVIFSSSSLIFLFSFSSCGTHSSVWLFSVDLRTLISLFRRNTMTLSLLHKYGEADSPGFRYNLLKYAFEQFQLPSRHSLVLLSLHSAFYKSLLG